MAPKGTERFDWIREELRSYNHEVQTFRNVDAAIRDNSQVSGKILVPLGPEPHISDFYHPNVDQNDRAIAFVILGKTATGLMAYKLPSNPKYLCFITMPAFRAQCRHEQSSEASRRALLHTARSWLASRTAHISRPSGTYYDRYRPKESRSLASVVWVSVRRDATPFRSEVD